MSGISSHNGSESAPLSAAGSNAASVPPSGRGRRAGVRSGASTGGGASRGGDCGRVSAPSACRGLEALGAETLRSNGSASGYAATVCGGRAASSATGKDRCEPPNPFCDPALGWYPSVATTVSFFCRGAASVRCLRPSPPPDELEVPGNQDKQPTPRRVFSLARGGASPPSDMIADHDPARRHFLWRPFLSGVREPWKGGRDLSLKSQEAAF